MNKEILEITKKFHDTYEKLASEYTYETREDTKVFDINSNNGKLMYATVNEIVSPILEENQELKSQLAGTTHCFDEEEHKKLKKQLEELKEEKQEWINLLAMFKNQQKEFIKYLEDEKDRLARECSNIYEDSLGHTRLVNEDKFNEVNDILQKYKEIIGDDK